VVLTFDDGYEDNYRFAFPILRNKQLSATFCVVTNYLDRQQPLWDWEVMCRACFGKEDINEFVVGSRILKREPNEARASFARRIIEQLKSCTISDLENAIHSLSQKCTGMEVQRLLDSSKPMNWEQVRTLSKQGMEIAAHSISHRSLARLPISEGIVEITQSKKRIENNLQIPCSTFAFPFGTAHDYNRSLVGVIKSSGFRSCLLAKPELNLISQNLFCINRITMYNDTDVRYLLG